MSEKEFQAKVIALCEILGLLWYHNPDSRRSKPGFPDLVIAGPNGVVFLELKTERGRVSAKQKEWIGVLKENGIMAAVVRPSSWLILQDFLCNLAGRNLVGEAV